MKLYYCWFCTRSSVNLSNSVPV